MALKQIDYGTVEYQMMVDLRNEILRKPLGLSFSKEDLEKEKEDVLIAAFDEDVILGCCLLSKISTDTVRLRQMAVKNNLQGKGIGQAIMNFAETLAKNKGYKKVYIHARDTAIGFYERSGYKVKGYPFTEVSILHHVMEKALV